MNVCIFLDVVSLSSRTLHTNPHHGSWGGIVRDYKQSNSSDVELTTTHASLNGPGQVWVGAKSWWDEDGDNRRDGPLTNCRVNGPDGGEWGDWQEDDDRYSVSRCLTKSRVTERRAQLIFLSLSGSLC